MLTRILDIDEYSLKLAKDIILRGDTVAFPTETVYGLGADAYRTDAVEKIFAVKGRPADNPLIVHVHKDFDILTLVKDVPDYALLLQKAFIPGPLTMVYASLGKVSSAVSCGLNTLAIRIPSHEGAQTFLKYLDLPIAAPSANLSKHVSPTSAEHVYSDLNGKTQLILNGGSCSGGIESTVLDCTGNIPVILRSGLITRDMIAQVAGDCLEYRYKDGERAVSPGMKYKHYSPRCKTMLFNYSERYMAFDKYREMIEEGLKAYLMCDDATASQTRAENLLNLGKTQQEVAANLYTKLREGEQVAEIIIAVAPEKRDGVMVGVMNRLEKACGN